VTPQVLSFLANTVLYFHVAIVAFNVFGLIVIPVGAWRDWAFIRIFWWRLVHVGLLVIVALQALFGRACFLTLWQYSLVEQSSGRATTVPLIQSWVEMLIFWPLPIWVFTVLYVLVVIYAGLLWYWIPPQRNQRI
jgi:hypothetical protein